MTLKKLFFVFLLLLFTVGLKAQLVIFNFKTISDGGIYAPKHVLAVWIEKEDGSFVKSLLVRANSRKQYLYSWKSKSAGNVVDATTGATITSHSAHKVFWNCRDLSGNLVPNGNYKIVVEFTEKHAQGPVFSFLFTVSAGVSNLTPPNQPNFIDMSFSYDPNAIGIEDFGFDNSVLKVQPNPSYGVFNLSLSQSILQSGIIEIVDITGKIIYSLVISNFEMANLQTIDLTKCDAGLYFLTFRSTNQIVRQKILIQ